MYLFYINDIRKKKLSTPSFKDKMIKRVVSQDT